MASLFNYHKQKEIWQDYEDDEQEWKANRAKYKGISPRPELFKFLYRHKNKQIKTARRLSEIYAFKLEFEVAQNAES